MVSIVICIYKEKTSWISRSIISLLEQTYDEIEIVVVVDNPLLDKAVVGLLEEYTKKDSRVHVHYNEKNIGAANSRNVGVSFSTGEYVAFLDADDYSYNNRIEKELSFLLSQQLDIVCSRYSAVDENELLLFESPINNKTINKVLPLYNPVANPTVLMKRSVFLALNGFRELVVCEDYDLWLRAVSAGYKIGLINDCLTYYTIRTGSLSHQNVLKTYYTNKLLRRFYKQRLNTGHDSFSKEYVDQFLLLKTNNTKKANRMNKASLYYDEAKKNKKLMIAFIFVSFCCSPKLIIERIALKIRLIFVK